MMPEYPTQHNPLHNITQYIDTIDTHGSFDTPASLREDFIANGLGFLSETHSLIDLSSFFNVFVCANVNNKPNISKYLELASIKTSPDLFGMYSKLSYFGYLDVKTDPYKPETQDHGYILENGYGLWDPDSLFDIKGYGLYFYGDIEPLRFLVNDQRMVELIILGSILKATKLQLYRIWGVI